LVTPDAGAGHLQLFDLMEKFVERPQSGRKPTARLWPGRRPAVVAGSDRRRRNREGL